MAEYHIALTGHRPNKLGGYNLNTKEYDALKEDLKNIILQRASKYDAVYCHTGLALGADTVWGLAILDSQKELDNVYLISECPSLLQSSSWFNQKDKDTWELLRKNAVKEYLYDDSEVIENKWQMVKALDNRNKGMVNHCDELLALLWNTNDKGGTLNTYNYALSIGKNVTLLSPSKYFTKR